jgi:hypothetical protein
MSDLELAKFLGIADDERWPRAIAGLTPEKRAVYERMADVCVELQLWRDGLGPRPEGVIICHEHKRGAPRRR